MFLDGVQHVQEFDFGGERMAVVDDWQVVRTVPTVHCGWRGFGTELMIRLIALFIKMEFLFHQPGRFYVYLSLTPVLIKNCKCPESPEKKLPTFHASRCRNFMDTSLLQPGACQRFWTTILITVVQNFWWAGLYSDAELYQLII